MSAGIKDKVVQTLKQTGNLSSGDLAEFSQPEAPAAPPKKAGEADKVQAPPMADPLLEAGKADSSANELADSTRVEADTGYLFGVEPLVEVEISDSDKFAFEDAIVLDARFKRPFTLFNGKVHGVFRSRTAEESRALLNELNRQWAIMAKAGDVPASEYSSTLRMALLICQIDELQSVKYPELTAPLTASAKVDDAGLRTVVPPKWYQDMFVIFGNISDGKQAALYKELCKFEQKYWTLVKHADDQNFWCPGASTSA